LWDSDSRTYCDNDCVLKDHLREILNSSNKRCTVVYKQSFSHKINCTEVNTLQQNHTELQMRQTGPGVGVSFKRESDSTPLIQTAYVYVHNHFSADFGQKMQCRQRAGSSPVSRDWATQLLNPAYTFTRDDS